MLSMSIATRSPTVPTMPSARSTPPGFASSTGSPAAPRRSAVTAGAPGPLPRDGELGGERTRLGGVEGDLDRARRAGRHDDPAEARATRDLEVWRRGGDRGRLERGRAGVEHGGVELGALEAEQHGAEVERGQRQPRRHGHGHDRPAAARGERRGVRDRRPRPWCRTPAPRRSSTGPGGRARPGRPWCRVRRARGGSARGGTRRRAGRRRSGRRRHRGRSASRLVASVTKAIWLPSALTAGDHDDRLPATGTPASTIPASTADTIASCGRRAGSSKMPFLSVSRSNRYTCDGHSCVQFSSAGTSVRSREVNTTIRPSSDIAGSAPPASDATPSLPDTSRTARRWSAAPRSHTNTCDVAYVTRHRPVGPPGQRLARRWCRTRTLRGGRSARSTGSRAPRYRNAPPGASTGMPATTCMRPGSAIGTVTSTTVMVATPSGAPAA